MERIFFRSKPGLHPMRRGEQQKKRRNLQCQMEGWDCWWSAWNILKSLKSSLQAWFALRRWCAKFWKYGCSILQPLPASFRPHMLICHCFSEIFSHAKLAKKTCFANECLIQRFASCSSTMPEKTYKNCNSATQNMLCLHTLQFMHLLICCLSLWRLI